MSVIIERKCTDLDRSLPQSSRLNFAMPQFTSISLPLRLSLSTCNQFRNVLPTQLHRRQVSPFCFRRLPIVLLYLPWQNIHQISPTRFHHRARLPSSSHCQTIRITEIHPFLSPPRLGLPIRNRQTSL